jgi:hypothetical protein
MFYTHGNDYGLTFDALRFRFPGVSFPSNEEITNAELGITSYLPTPLPHYDPMVEGVRELNPVNGAQRWQVFPLPPGEVTANLANAREQLKNAIMAQVQERLDNFAKEKGYDDVNSTSKYQNISDDEIALLPLKERTVIETFRTECRLIAVKTALTWAVLTGVLHDVEQGLRPVPGGYSEIEAELPVLSWE